MGIRFHSGWLGRFPRQGGTILCTVFLALNGGCPNFPGGPPPVDNGNDNEAADGNGEVTAEMITPLTGFGLSALEEPVSFFYSVDESATDVRGFYIPVADGSLNSAPIGDRVITTADLATGVRRVFFFDPEEAGVGFYRVGIEFSLNGQAGDAESQAVIHVQGSPDPIFIQPSESLTQVSQGAEVFISFDVRDPEEDVQWRLFYLSETDSRTDPADQLGTELKTGSGNAGTYTLNTGALAPGNYQLGISATDSGSSVAATSDPDRIVTFLGDPVSARFIEVLTPIVSLPPTIEITAPGATNESIPSGGSFTIRFIGTINEPGAIGTIEVFYDTDSDEKNGFTTIPGAANLPVSATSVAFPTGVPAGTYYIGAIISDGINEPVSDYAGGKLIVTPAP